MILPAEKHGENPQFRPRLVRYEIENRIVLCHVAQSVQNVRHKRALEWNLSETGQTILDPSHPYCSAVQRILDGIAKIAIGLEQMVENRLDIRIASTAAEDIISLGHALWPQSCLRSGGDLHPQQQSVHLRAR